MNKTVKIIIAVAVIIVAVVAVLVGIFAFNNNSKPASNLSVSSADDLTALVDQIYAGVSIEMPSLMTMPIDTTDADAVKSFTGLDTENEIEYAVVSEPMMSSQAYSLVLVKVKNGINADEVAETMNKQINERKWICVTAEKIYSVASGDVVCLVMTNAETAQPVFESFKTIAGSVGQVYERTAEEPEMPEDMLPGSDLEIPGDMPIDDQPAAMPDDDMLMDDQPAAM